jgi:basic amino acid/polyamine antiporter, APA family
MESPPKKIGTGTLTVLGVDLIVGLGIFTLAGDAVQALGSWTLTALVVTGALLTIVALAFGELVALAPRNGGPYAFLDLAFGSKAAVPLAWTYCVGLSVGTGCYLAIAADLLAKASWITLGPGGARLFVVLYLAAIGYLNVRGLKLGSRAVSVMTLLKTFPLLILGAVGGIKVLLDPPAPPLPAPSPSTGLLYLLFVCQGFEMLPVVAGEARSPAKAVGRAMVLSLWASIALYLVLFAGLLHLPAGTASGLSGLAASLGGAAGSFLEAVLVVSILGLVAGRVFLIPRLIAVLSEDRFFPPILAKAHPRFGSPSNAVAGALLTALPFVFFADVESYAGLSALTVSCQFLLGSICLLKVAKTSRRLVLGGLSALVSIWFLSRVPWKGWAVFGLMQGLAVVVFYWMRARGGGDSAPTVLTGSRLGSNN